MSVTCLRVSEYPLAEEKKGPSEMRSLLLPLGLALCCFLQANGDVPVESVDPAKMLGSFFVTAVATNCPKIKGMAKRVPVTPMKVEKDEEGLKTTIWMKTPHGCKSITVPVKKEDGKYVVYCERGGKKILDTIDFKDEAAFTLIKVINKGHVCYVAALTVDDVAKTEKYLPDLRAFSDRNNLKGEEMITPTTEGMCDPSSS